MLSRLVSLALTLYMIALAINLVRQSMTLVTLRNQVAEMESRLGSATPPDASKIWIKLFESTPEGGAWRLYIPPIKEYRMSKVVPDSNGKFRIRNSHGLRSSGVLLQQSMIRISRSESQGKATYFISLQGAASIKFAPGFSKFLCREFLRASRLKK